MSTKEYLKAEAYVQFTALVAINEGCVCTCENFMEGLGVLNIVENRTCLPSALVKTLHHLSVHRTIMSLAWKWG